MVIARDADSIRKEIEYAEDRRDQHLAALKGLIAGFTTPFWRSATGEMSEERTDYQPENHNYKLLRYMTAKLAYSRPVVDMTSRMVGMEDEMKERQVVLDQWMQDHRVERLGQQLSVDFMLCTAASHVTTVEHPYLTLSGPYEDGEPAVDVVWERLSPRKFFFDPAAETRETREYEGHGWVTDKESLLALAEKDESWDREAIEGLPDTALGEIEDPSAWKRQGIPDRKEIGVYQVWFRDGRIVEENTPRKGYHGVIYTLAVVKSQDGSKTTTFLREPMDFFGPASGPYVAGEVYYVPDSSFGLAPCIAHEGQNRDLNRHARGVSDMAARYKRLILCASAKVAEELKARENDYIITIPGLEDTAVVPLEIGGVTDQVLSYLQLAAGRLEAVSGLSEALQGEVSGDGTATEQTIAKAASDIAVDFVKARFTNLFEEGLSKVDWYINMHPDFRAAISPEILGDEYRAEVPEGSVLVFSGGNAKVPPEMLSIDIEPMSMERTSEALQQKRIVDLLQVLGQVIPLKAQFPSQGWDKLLEKIGEAVNMPGLGDLFGDMAVPTMAPEQATAGTQQRMMRRVQPESPRSLPGNQTGGNISAATRTA